MSAQLQGIPQLMTVLEKMRKELNKKSKNLIQQASIKAIISASKATEPGDKTKVSELQQKYKFRPIETIKGVGYSWYKKEDEGAKPYFFKTKAKITVTGKKAKNRKSKIKKITRGIKYWSKKSKRFDYLPYEGSGKFDKSDKRSKIHFAGAAKAGWLRNLPPKKKKPDGLKAKRPIHKRIERFTDVDQFISMENLVDYVSKTSANSAKIGIDSATSQMIKDYERKLKELAEKASV